MKELVINSTTQHTLLLFLPLIIAAILRLAKIRGSSIIGGVFGGIILGPAIFGYLAPTYWEGIFQGGIQEHQLVQQLEQQQKVDIEAAEKIGASDVVIVQINNTNSINPSPRGKLRSGKTNVHFAITFLCLCVSFYLAVHFVGL